MKRTIIIIVIVALVILAFFRLKATHDKINLQKESLVNVNYVSVNVADVKRMAADRTLSLVGTLATDNQLNIAAETEGKLVSFNCETGQSKEKGAVIGVIDDKIKKLAVQSAKINADKAQKDLNRIEKLYKGGTSSEQELDNARTAYDNAKNQLEQAEKQLAYTKILAPISGVITQKLVEEGAYINKGNPVAYIVNISKLKVQLNVSESNVYYLKTGQGVKITTDVYPGVEFDGKISFISPKGDASHNYPVEVEIKNNSRHQLKAGTFVNVLIQVSGASNELYIPREALLGSVQDASVYVAQNDKVVIRKIVVGRQTNESLEVKSGLSEGEKVVTNGQVNLSDNKQIKIINK